MVKIVSTWVTMKLVKPTPHMLVWVSDNRGAMTSIAEKAGVSPQFVHLVLRGARSSSDGRVERLLREKGAPLPDREPEPALT
jgi:hypothetical protein